MNVRDHTEIEALLAVDALDGLDANEREELGSLRAAHGDCDACRDLQRGFREAAALLAASLPPAEVDPAAADRVLAQAVRTPAPADELAARRSRRGRGWSVLAVAAAVVLVVVASLAVLRPGAQPVTIAAWRQRVVTFSASGGSASAGELAMAYAPGHPGVALWGSDLPDPGAGKTYEVWMIAGTTPTSGGCLRPIDGTVGAFVHASLGSSDLMAVTIEPDSCPASPTTTPVLTATLS